MGKKFTKEQLQQIKRMINSLRRKGISDQKIYDELIRFQSDEVKKMFNLAIRMIAKEARNKYRILNNVLIVILSKSILLRFLPMLNMRLSSGEDLIFSVMLGLVFGALLSIVPIFFLVEVIKKKAYIYKPLGIIFIASSFTELRLILDTITLVSKLDYILVILELMIPILGAIISFYIAKKLLPNLKHAGIKLGYWRYRA
ncbi:MAG: hypothetical protein KKE11_02415 [Gammaproteobacteria bacterium]|nr:hypothetical protein [Gammaproteobacteria bacterium]